MRYLKYRKSHFPGTISQQIHKESDARFAACWYARDPPFLQAGEYNGILHLFNHAQQAFLALNSLQGLQSGSNECPKIEVFAVLFFHSWSQFSPLRVCENEEYLIFHMRISWGFDDSEKLKALGLMGLARLKPQLHSAMAQWLKGQIGMAMENPAGVILIH